MDANLAVSIHLPLLGEASRSCPLTLLEDFKGFGGILAEVGGVSTDPLLFSTEMPRPFLDAGRLGLEASRPADLIAASSSFLLGSCI